MVDKTKRKFGGDVGTCWTLFFSSGRVAVHAAATIRRINKDSSVLMPGTAVLVEKDVVSLTWKSEVQQASIVKFFYGGDRRPLFGPAGKFQPWHAEVQSASRSNAEAAASSAKVPSLWQATNSYPSLPAHLGHCQFDRMSCWGGRHAASTGTRRLHLCARFCTRDYSAACARGHRDKIWRSLRELHARSCCVRLTARGSGS
jgi:hypothetical protein